MYISLKEKAKMLRKELKEVLGATSKDISVTSKSSLNVSIKNLKIDKNKVEELAKKYESVDYCEYTGEILAGGNDFVFVDYDYRAVREEAENHMEKAEILAEREVQENTFETIYEDAEIIVQYGKGIFKEIRVETKNDSVSDDRKYMAHSKYEIANALAMIIGRYDIYIEL